MISPETYVNIGAAVFGLYGVQMTVMPRAIHDDHFEDAGTKYTDFWVRGHAATIGAAIYAIKALPAEEGAKAMLAWTTGIAILYPLNAKFGVLSDVKPKYPMHYVPEALMSGLVVAGLLATQK
mmetsp:Transcript_6744/g.17368  ORF Transcript_6744/g.17368 Transcript_6744/m.17368 type:complete len:123 (-) Transcript_6744:93-461(-)|eukprot:CAMPEP_0182925482 /NCGR_PEP_ID=MMETSP0105_2-20130417/9435_1 /TAXON_ID=81532 ORGANISM="Acanthoeca-like sp., Strain 10tr" /NCGR_SAMPLE_ID=MMETSP0105_2 /ASSEMBLY_ACC=CAM_ASM_000205 /LENGTH=122 /DNA_ID=CAMNT_0025063333 /DNA_START=46 /DNA_END=414 /DNA_ORIENTATION=-